MISKRHNYWLIFLVSFVLQIPVYANCSKSYTVGVFNGVWNTEYEANAGREKLKILIATTYNSEPVNYESFYNHTGSSVGATALQDIAETFIQRSA